MIDYSNEIFTLVARRLREDFEGVTVIGESVDMATKFPTVTIDEVSNIPTEKDSRTMNKYAHVRYRVQVFSNNPKGKRAEARKLYAVVDEVLQSHNLDCKSFSTTPDVYNAKVYQINATHEAVICENGTIYKAR